MRIDDIPLTNNNINNIAQMKNKLWLMMMNDNDYTDTIVTFQEYMQSFEAHNEGFVVTFLRSNKRRVTGCIIWQTSITRDNFERF